MNKHNYYQLLTNIESVKVGDELTFTDVFDFMGRIVAVTKAGAVLAERNLYIRTVGTVDAPRYFIGERGANERPTIPSPLNHST